MNTSIADRRSPYKGLIPYSEGDAPFFFGRDKETRLISANLFASPLTLLYGASGVGKSSVLRAGVAHQLRQRDDLIVVSFSAWQSNPVRDLVQSIAEYAERADHVAWRKVTNYLDSSGLSAASISLSDFLAVCYEQMGRRLMIILDQFEEYFLYHPQEDGFADEFPQAVLQADVPVSFLISIREDSLAKLDRFEGRIPALFDNYLRIEHLNRSAARDAIVKPIEQYNKQRASDEPPVSIEPALVEEVLKQVETGQVILGEAGRGVLKTEAAEAKIETPFLQMVMMRLWDEELSAGSRVLRLETLERLGNKETKETGAERIVRTHLDATMSALDPQQQDIAAEVFHYLVTPSGTKIAHTVPDLAQYAKLPHAQLAPALEVLAGSDRRILRGVNPPLDQPTESRYEIFHDVLAGAILDWRTRHVQARERAEAERLAAEQQREAAERARVAEKVKTAGRLRWLSVALALMTLLALFTAAYAFKQRNRAEADATKAQTQANEANVARAAAEEQRGLADTQRKRADEQTELAQKQADEAVKARGEAEAERQRANEQAALAHSRAVEADKARGEAVTARGVAEEQRQRANQQAAINKSRELAAAARSNLNSDPELSVLLALRSVAELTGEGLTTIEKQGIKETDRKEALEALHEAVQASHIRHTLGHNTEVGRVAYGLKGQRVITRDIEGAVKLWDATSGQLLGDMVGHPRGYTQLAVSPDGARLAFAVKGGAVEVRDLAGGEIVRTLPGDLDNQTIEGTAFTRDGSMLAVVRPGDVRLLNIATGDVAELPYGPYDIFSLRVELLTFSEDGKTLVAGGCIRADRAGCSTIGVTSWDVGTRRESRPPVSLSFPAYPKVQMTFSPGGERLFTVTRDGTAKIWDATSGKELFDLTATRARYPAAFNGDGKKLVFVAENGAIMQWDTVLMKAVTNFKGEFSEVKQLAYSPNGKHIAAYGGEIVKILEAASGKEVLTLAGHKGEIKSIAFSPDGQHLGTASEDQTAKLWDISPSKELLTITEPRNSGFFGIVFNSDGTRLAGVSSQTAKLWAADSGAELLALEYDMTIMAFDYSPDGKRLATGSLDGPVNIWDIASQKEILSIEPEYGTVNDVALSYPDGKLLATASQNSTAQIWDAVTGRRLHELSGHTNAVTSVAFSPDGQYVATGSIDMTAKLWDVKTGRELHALSGHTGKVSKVAFSPDGKRLATASLDRNVKVWDVSTGKELGYLSGHDDDVNDVEFSPDGRLIATASDDETVKVWDANTGLELLSLTSQTGRVFSVAFSPDGLRLATTVADGTARVYTLDPQKLVNLARARVSRHELTAEERKRYLHELPKQ